MIVVTGSNGFIGSNLIKGLNEMGIKDIIAVDDHSNLELKENIAHCEIQDYIDIEEFLDQVISNQFDNKGIRAVFHQGACSNTMEWDAEYLYKNNLLYSKELLKLSKKLNIPLIYASSASVYGSGKNFEEFIENEDPINPVSYTHLTLPTTPYV